MAGISPHLILFAFSAFPGKPFLNLGIGGIGAKSVHTADYQTWNRLRINQWEDRDAYPSRRNKNGEKRGRSTGRKARFDERGGNVGVNWTG